MHIQATEKEGKKSPDGTHVTKTAQIGQQGRFGRLSGCLVASNQHYSFTLPHTRKVLHSDKTLKTFCVF